MKAEYEILTKIKSVLVDEKRHIRFGDWNGADIEVKFIIIYNTIELEMISFFLGRIEVLYEE